MISEIVTVQKLFQDRRQYRVPFYQRPYVWNKEDQWERLWTDISDKAEERLSGEQPTPHFLGAVVLEPQSRKGLLGVDTLHIIDGQQRLTTLQYLLSALALLLIEGEQTALLSIVRGCLENANLDTMENPDVEVFKVWPTFRDRISYRHAMTAGAVEELRQRFPQDFTQTGELRKVGLLHPPALEAIWYFAQQMRQWKKDRDETAALNALTEATLKDLKIVSIALGEDDDAQIIFETLNGHGAQLHATDLIRNYIFMRADNEPTQSVDLYNNVWSQFEATFWSEEQRRGRLTRPRLEWFVQTALQAEHGNEIEVGRLYAEYRRFAGERKKPKTAAQQLAFLNAHAENYRSLISGSGDAAIARFGRRVSPWDASTTHSVALAIANSNAPPDEREKIFSYMISYLVRRGVCGLTAKSYNKIFIQALKQTLKQPTAENFGKFLAHLDGDASRWPTDSEFSAAWLFGPVYEGTLDAPKVRMVLVELENCMRSERSEEPFAGNIGNLDIDHILPTSWFEYWPLPDGSSATQEEAAQARMAAYGNSKLPEKPTAILRRERAKLTMGNLTLAHYGVNRGLQNFPFAKKRTAFFRESNLQINRSLMIADNWNEETIVERGTALFPFALTLWPRPAI